MVVNRLKNQGLHFVGGVAGLALQVTETGGRSWILRVMVGGKRRDMGLGGFPDVTLSGAKEAARAARLKIREGIDPILESRQAKSALKVANEKAVTFEWCADAFITSKEREFKNLKHRKQWRVTLETYAFPIIGKMIVADVERAHIIKILEPIWQTKTETATRVRGRLESVLDWATVRGYRSGENPALWKGKLDKLLPKPRKITKVVHQPALPHSEIKSFMTRLRAAAGTGARALEFTILTAARSGETRGARWSEIDLVKKLWTVPEARMKMEREHQVPLSAAAISILNSMERSAEIDLIFPGADNKQMSDMTLLSVLRRLEYTEITVHGFRSTFADWSKEMTMHEGSLADKALAHKSGDAVKDAYHRSVLLEKRRRLMDDWAAYCVDY